MNPVFKKDLRGLLRLHRVAATQLVFVALLAGLVLVTWPSEGIISLAASRNDSLLLGLMLGQLLMLVCFVPGVAAVGVTSEREQGTFEMLYASRLTPFQLITGKLLGGLSFPALLLMSGLPFVALLAYRGEVNFAVLSQAYVVLVLSAVLLAMVALAISSRCRQSSTALIASYCAVFALCGAALVPAAIMLGSSGGWFARLLHGVRSLSPVSAMLSILQPSLGELGGRGDGADSLTGEPIPGFPPAWRWFIPAAAVVIVLCASVLIVTLSRSPEHDDRASTRRRLMPSLPAPLRRLFFLIDPNRRKGPMGSFNPLFAREMRTNALRSGPWMIRIFYCALLVSMGLALMALYGGQTEHGDLLRYVAMVLVAFQIGLILVINPSLTTPSISGEVEADTFELMRLTRLGAGKIFWGKFVPSLLPAGLAVLAMLPAYGVVCFVNTAYLGGFLRLMPVCMVLSITCCAVGILCSSLTSTTTRATVANYVIMAGIAVLPLVAWSFGGTVISSAAAASAGAVSPLVVGLQLLPGGQAAVADWWLVNLAIVAGIGLIALVLARARIGRMLERGAA